MKVGLVADTHFGVRNDGKRFLDHQCKFYDEVFFPELERRGVKAVLHHGDLVDRRKFISFKTAHRMRNVYLDRLNNLGIEHHVIVGNHDTSLRDTIEVNALRELIGDRPGHLIATEPQNIQLGSLDFLLLPWICGANAKQCLDMIETSGAAWCVAHLELAGFEMSRGNVMEKGMSRSLFDGFDHVTTGHFHHGSTQGNIQYLGAPYEMTWEDYGCDRGFHILDTETREVEFVKNPLTLHSRLTYSDDKPAAEIDWTHYQDKIVRVYVGKRENGLRFDEWMKELDSVNADIKVEEDRVVLEASTDAVQHSGNTMGTMSRYVDEHFIGELDEKAALKAMLADVYREALERHE